MSARGLMWSTSVDGPAGARGAAVTTGGSVETTGGAVAGTIGAVVIDWEASRTPTGAGTSTRGNVGAAIVPAASAGFGVLTAGAGAVGFGTGDGAVAAEVTTTGAFATTAAA